MKTSHLKSEFCKAGSAKLESSLPSAQNSADCPTPHGAKTAAFARIELVVVAGLGLLGAMSLAATTGSKAASDAATCVANSGQLLRAWQMYSADNHGKLVPNGYEGSQGSPQWCAGVELRQKFCYPRAVGWEGEKGSLRQKGCYPGEHG